jgi:N-acetylmuramoyl-L-alanine amidase
MGSRWAGLWAIVAAAVLLAVGAAAVAQPLYPDTPAPIGLRLGGDAASTRLVLDLAAAPGRRIAPELAGGRLTLTIAGAAPDAAMEGKGHGLVTAWRIRAEDGAAEVVADVAPGSAIQRRFLIPPSGEAATWRYVVDLTTATPAPVAATSAPEGLETVADDIRAYQTGERRPAPAPRATPVSAPAVSSRAVDDTPRPPFGRLKVIVIDPGHGGHDTGAQSLVRNEKDINLAAALDLRARLERTGRYRVVMTRDTDIFIPLPERVRIARAAKADLFISLHADSAGSDPTPHGASVYTLADKGVTRVHDVIGPQGLFGGGARNTNSPVGQILLDLTQRATRNRSAEFAGMLLAHLSGDVDLLPRSQRDADYYVLLAPDVPAVLLEMGFITNPADELRLTDPDELRGMMDHVGDAIDAYFAPHTQVAAE